MTMISPYVFPGKAREFKLTPEDIIAIVCEHFEVTRFELMQGNSSKAFRHVWPRYVAWNIIKEYYPKVTLLQLGEMFGGFDHTSVRNSFINIKPIMLAYPDFEAKVKQIHFTIREVNSQL